MLSSSAFLASVYGAEDLAGSILNCAPALMQDPLRTHASLCWEVQVGATLSSSEVLQPALQKS